MGASGLTAGLLGSLVAACTDDTGSGASDGASDGDSARTEAEEAIARIGRGYREERPDEDDREVLLERLGIEAGAGATPAFLPALDAQMAEDYRSDRTVRIDGWLLSLTEGRAAALVSLA